MHARTKARPERYRAPATLVAGTGLQQGEAFALTVARDFLRRRQHVPQVGRYGTEGGFWDSLFCT